MSARMKCPLCFAASGIKPLKFHSLPHQIQNRQADEAEPREMFRGEPVHHRHRPKIPRRIGAQPFGPQAEARCVCFVCAGTILLGSTNWSAIGGICGKVGSASACRHGKIGFRSGRTTRGGSGFLAHDRPVLQPLMKPNENAISTKAVVRNQGATVNAAASALRIAAAVAIIGPFRRLGRAEPRYAF